MRRFLNVRISTVSRRAAVARVRDPSNKQREYFKLVFGTEAPERDRVKAALEKAHEIRQFEIRLYWQRSLFFWGFDLAFFTVYFLLLTSDTSIKFETFMYIGLALAGYLRLLLGIMWRKDQVHGKKIGSCI